MRRRSRFYLDKRNAKILGVCAGIADYFGVDTVWVRTAMVLGTIFGGGFLAVAYVVIAAVADRKPDALYVDSHPDWLAGQERRAAPSRSISDVRSAFRDIDRRLSDIERRYTSAESRLAREIDDLR